MNPKLQTAFDRLEKADPETQERWATTIIMTIDENGRDEYAEYVDAELAKGQADIDAGRGRPAREVFPELRAEMKAKYGAV